MCIGVFGLFIDTDLYRDRQNAIHAYYVYSFTVHATVITSRTLGAVMVEVRIYLYTVRRVVEGR